MRRVIAAGVAWGLAALLLAPPATAASGSLGVQVSIDDRPIADATVPIDPANQVTLRVVATNSGATPVKVRSVRLSGVALALTFFAYDTTAPFEVPARGEVTRTFVLDLGDLAGQATGLLPSSVELLDAQRDTLGEATTVADIRGSFWSVYGVFGLAMLVLTVLAWLAALLALARHRLAANRWRRGLRFLPAGFGTGLVAVITLSVLRLVPPEPAIELPVVLGAAAIAFLLGYLTPNPVPPPVPPGSAPPDGGDPFTDGRDPESTVRLPLPATGEFTR